jgi:ABC-type transporter Mla maintaining outer membrane lipid asymmetry ATPase subunit MlaF
MNAVPPKPPLAIEMRDLSVVSLSNPNRTVATGVNWTVNTGEFWVVAAPQHSGKTDLLMTTGGIISPAAGEYFFLGERMPIFSEAKLGHRLKQGFVFDGGQLLSHLTVAENIALPLRYHRNLSAAEITARVGELLEITELTPWANSSPGNVGRSWRQRAGLARALTLQPELLLLDSPLTGLAARQTSWWLRFLDDLSRGHRIAGGQPITLIATADDLRPWRGHARRVACLAGGRFHVFADWQAVEISSERAVQVLLDE